MLLAGIMTSNSVCHHYKTFRYLLEWADSQITFPMADFGTSGDCFALFVVSFFVAFPMDNRGIHL